MKILHKNNFQKLDSSSIFILNSNLFSDLIYHVKFQTYFKCTEPHKSKFAKLPGPPQIFQKKNEK